MFEYYVWIISFVFLYLSVFWIIVFYMKEKKTRKLEEYPSVSIIVPAYNEEKNIGKTLNSILSLDYPVDKLKIIVVDDCSSDNTAEVVKEFDNVKLVQRKERGGNAAVSMNTGLKYVDTDLFARVDADSRVSRDSFKKLVDHFSDKKVGSVISSILVDEPKSSLEKMQKFEYIITNFTRKLMSKIRVLNITNGVLSAYKTNLVKKLGGFDEKNLTEDFEIALRIIRKGYDVVMEPSSLNYTHVPRKFSDFWKQRVRWYRGFITSMIKHKSLLFNKNYGILGLFLFPVSVLSMFLVLFSFVMLIYRLFDVVYDWSYKLITLGTDIFSIPEIPDVGEFILSIDVRIYIPVFISLVFGFYVYLKAHKYYNEKRIYSIVTIIYLFFYPIITSVQWFHALILEMGGAKRKW